MGTTNVIHYVLGEDYQEKCLYTSRTGAKVPLLINRDQPEGDINAEPQ